HAHFAHALGHAGTRKEGRESLRVRGRSARLEPRVQRVDEMMVRVDLERAIFQVAARLDGFSFTLLERDGRGILLTDQLALETVQKFLFRPGTFQVRL